MNKLLLVLALLSVSFVAHAQSGVMQAPGCPPGVAPGDGGCGGGNGNGAPSTTPAYTGPLWEDRYGALANDGNGAGGIARNMKSKRAAKQEALRDCGNSNCKIKVSVRNGCLAATWGGGVAAYGVGDDVKGAENNALTDCKKGNEANCTVTYSACSLPVRVQ